MVTVSLPSLSDPPTGRLLLVIPLEKIQPMCFHPVKWLRFVGWTIFHATGGYLSNDSDGNDRLSDKSPLADEDFVFYQAPGFNPNAVVDLDIVAARHTASRTSISEANCRDSHFWNDIVIRDGTCVFTDWEDADACHIIPFACRNEAMTMLAQQRSNPVEDINDKRNGFLCCDTVHKLFDKRNVAILFTPNGILECDDVPRAVHPPNPGEDRPLLPNSRYTLQHIDVSDQRSQRLERNYASHNQDARFRNLLPTELPQPALLHYVYGAAILTAFGKSVNTWQASGKWERPPRQSYPSKRPYSERTKDNREVTRAKREEASPYPSASTSSDVRSGRRHITNERAMDYMFAIASRQVACCEHAQWEQRKLEIDTWVNACAKGCAAVGKQDGQKGRVVRTRE